MGPVRVTSTPRLSQPALARRRNAVPRNRRTGRADDQQHSETRRDPRGRHRRRLCRADRDEPVPGLADREREAAHDRDRGQPPAGLRRADPAARARRGFARDGHDPVVQRPAPRREHPARESPCDRQRFPGGARHDNDRRDRGPLRLPRLRRGQRGRRTDPGRSRARVPRRRLRWCVRRRSRHQGRGSVPTDRGRGWRVHRCGDGQRARREPPGCRGDPLLLRAAGAGNASSGSPLAAQSAGTARGRRRGGLGGLGDHGRQALPGGRPGARPRRHA